MPINPQIDVMTAMNANDSIVGIETLTAISVLPGFASTVVYPASISATH
jgi:hypothetical protein